MISVLLLCLKIFVFRIIDVSMATFRTVIVVKGKSFMAASVALIEGLIWFLVVREALSFEAANMIESLCIAVAYAGGFSAGTYVGTIVSKKVEGMVQVQIITSEKNDSVIQKIQDEGYALTVIKSEATKFSGEKYMIFAEIKSSKLDSFKNLVQELDPKAFLMVNETKHVFNGFIKK